MRPPIFVRRAFVLMLLIALFTLLVQMVDAQNGYPIQNATYVNDFANLLSAQDISNLNVTLANLKRTAGVDAVVVTISTVSGYRTGDSTIESFATHLFNTWRLGNAQTNRGVLILVAVKDRKVRIEVGAGYDASYNRRMQGVIDNQMLPSFRENLYSKGILQGVQGVIQVVTTPSSPMDILFSKVDPSVLGITAVVGLGFIGYGFLYRIQHRCPNCGQVTLNIQSVTLVSATYHSTGEREVTSDCPNCGYHNTRTVTIPRHYRTPSGGNRSSGGSSGGGGHSSGGGASGSW